MGSRPRGRDRSDRGGEAGGIGGGTCGADSLGHARSLARLGGLHPRGGEHAAAAVTAGMSMTGLRATNFSSGQGIAYMHESLYAAVGKRLTYVLNVAARAITKHALNVHAGHDDYHAVDDTGFFQLFAKNVQEAGDFSLIAHRIAELSLNPGLNAQDGFLTSHVIETVRLPERALIKEFLGDPADMIDSPTPAQRLVFGAQRRPGLIEVLSGEVPRAAGPAARAPTAAGSRGLSQALAAADADWVAPHLGPPLAAAA